MPFRNEEIILLREAGIDSLLPTFDVYSVRKNLHFSKQCASPETPAVQRSFLEVANGVLSRCKECQQHPLMQLYRRINSECSAVPRALGRIKKIEDVADACAAGMGPDIGPLSMDLTSLHYDSSDWLETFTSCRELSSYVKTFSARIKAVNDTMVSYVRTSAVKQAIMNKPYFGGYVDQEVYGSAMFLIDDLVDYTLLVAKAYGEEIISGVWMIPDFAAGSIANGARITFMNIPSDVSTEVLQTMARLWEPGSHTALGDGNKVYAAAVILTTET